jgi:hypothetical protein
MDFDTTDLKVYKFTNKFKFSEFETEFDPTIREHDLRVDFPVRYQININKRIDEHLRNDCNNSLFVKNSDYAIVNWCVSRPGLWYTIEPIHEISQFKSREPKQNEYYVKFGTHGLTYPRWARGQGIKYEKMFINFTSKPVPHTYNELYLQPILRTKFERCVLLFIGSFKACREKIGPYLEKSIQPSMIRDYPNEYNWPAIGPSLNKSFRIVANKEYLDEFLRPFRCNLMSDREFEQSLSKGSKRKSDILQESSSKKSKIN